MKSVKFIAIIALLGILAGCGTKITSTLVPDYKDRKVRLVALLPVDNKTTDEVAARELRREILDALYFKGYPKIPLKVIDDRLSEFYSVNLRKSKGHVAPEVAGKILGVDAVFYCTLNEWKTSSILVYASSTIEASLELRSAATGETLWSSTQRLNIRNYDITGERLKEKKYQCYEPAARNLLQNALASLPDGPESVGKPPRPESWIKRLWGKF